jgi:hypothetical protein
MDTNITIDHNPNDVVGERRIDVRRGSTNGRVSQEWFSRPADQRFTSISALMDSLNARSVGMKEDVIDARDLCLVANQNDTRNLFLVPPDGGEPLGLTNHVFGQMCSLAGAPASYLREKPAFLAAVNLMDDLAVKRDLNSMLYWNEVSREARAFTGEGYGRIMDHTLGEAVQKIAGDGTGDTCWKIPGQIDWSKNTYNPYVSATTESTTLYASDRDVFFFLVDDTHPIEIGKLDNGDPDYVFRGFYAWNSEVGSRSLGIATFMLRGICMNRNLWGVEGFDSLKINHTRFAPDRFVRDAEPALNRYVKSEPNKLIAGINAAKEAIVARDDEARMAFLKSLDFSKVQSRKILDTVEREEGHYATSAFDFVQGITAVARTIEHQDRRLDLEKVGARIMDKASRNAF